MSRLLIAVAFLAACVPSIASAQTPLSSYVLPPTAFSFSANATVVFGLNSMSSCTITVDSGATFGSGTITINTSGNGAAFYSAVTGFPDLGSSTGGAQTITAAGKKLTFPVSSMTNIELVLSGSTSPSITGEIFCSQQPVVLP